MLAECRHHRKPLASAVAGKRLRSAGGVGILPRGLAMEESLTDIAQEHGIVLALKFGSSVTGQEHPRSDVDLAVLLDRANVTLAFSHSSRIASSISRLSITPTRFFSRRSPTTANSFTALLRGFRR